MLLYSKAITVSGSDAAESHIPSEPLSKVSAHKGPEVQATPLYKTALLYYGWR